jgi:hypothetical protein
LGIPPCIETSIYIHIYTYVYIYIIYIWCYMIRIYNMKNSDEDSMKISDKLYRCLNISSRCPSFLHPFGEQRYIGLLDGLDTL